MATTKDFEDNVLLLKEYKNGDDSALEKLLILNASLIMSIAKRFIGRGQELEDIIEVGKIGLIKAANGFDEERGCCFSTYAFPMITGEIKRFLRDDGIIRVSRELRKNSFIIAKAKESFFKEHLREARLHEICEITKLSEEEITTSLEATSHVSSLDDLTSADGNLTYADILSSEDNISHLTERLALRQEIESLCDFEKKLINLRYFKNLTQSKVAEILGTSQVTISRTEKKIIDKLRQKIL